LRHQNAECLVNQVKRLAIREAHTAVFPAISCGLPKAGLVWAIGRTQTRNRSKSRRRIGRTLTWCCADIDEKTVKQKAIEDEDLKPLWDSMSGLCGKRNKTC
jgi:hypothetical protein